MSASLDSTNRCSYCLGANAHQSDQTVDYIDLLRPQLSKLRDLQNRCGHAEANLKRALAQQFATADLTRTAHLTEARVRKCSIHNSVLSERINEARARLKSSQDRLEERRRTLRAHTNALRALQDAKVEQKRELDRQLVAFDMVARGLRDRQALQMRLLHSIVPVRVSGVAPSTRKPLQVNVASLRLTEVPLELPESMRSAAVLTSAACGYIVLHLELFASIMGAPLLHGAAYCGLQSAIWQPVSFWQQGADANQRLVLSGVHRDGASVAFAAPSPLMSTWGAAPSLDHQDQLRQDSALSTGLRMLQRSTACACGHYMLQRRQTLPLHWSPFGWLWVVYKVTTPPLPHEQPLWDLVYGGVSQGAPPQLLEHPCFRDHEFDEGEWVQPPTEVLPPPPSEVDATQDWERVMFKDQQQARHWGNNTLGRVLSSGRR